MRKEFCGMPVLVTGASGFIGSHLCRRLVREGATVQAVSREFREPDAEGLQWFQVDLENADEVCALVRSLRPHIVFHLASHVSGGRDLNEVLPTFTGNLRSTIHFLIACTECKCSRIVVAQSSEEPIHLDGYSVPCSPYAAAKWSGSAYGRMFHSLFQTPVVMPRIFMTYGPAQKDLSKLVPYVTLSLLRGETPKLTSGGRLADWIYVDDVVSALMLSAIIPGLEGCSFDVGSGTLTSVREIARLICNISRIEAELDFGSVPDRLNEQQRAADTAFAKTRLAWEPQMSLEDGLAHTIQWYRDMICQSVQVR